MEKKKQMKAHSAHFCKKTGIKMSRKKRKQNITKQNKIKWMNVQAPE